MALTILTLIYGVQYYADLIIFNNAVKYTTILFFFFQAEDGIRDRNVTGVQTCALPIWSARPNWPARWRPRTCSRLPRTPACRPVRTRRPRRRRPPPHRRASQRRPHPRLRPTRSRRRRPRRLRPRRATALRAGP